METGNHSTLPYKQPVMGVRYPQRTPWSPLARVDPDQGVFVFGVYPLREEATLSLGKQLVEIGLE